MTWSTLESFTYLWTKCEGGLSSLLLIFYLLPVSSCCHSTITQSGVYGGSAVGCCSLRSYWKMSKIRFLPFCCLSCNSWSFQDLRKFPSICFFLSFFFKTEFASPEQKKQKRLMMKKLIGDPLYPEVWGGWEVERWSWCACRAKDKQADTQ